VVSSRLIAAQLSLRRQVLSGLDFDRMYLLKIVE